jgi:hypothetical protein
MLLFVRLLHKGYEVEEIPSLKMMLIAEVD